VGLGESCVLGAGQRSRWAQGARGAGRSPERVVWPKRCLKLSRGVLCKLNGRVGQAYVPIRFLSQKPGNLVGASEAVSTR
jgi:hypothetical protein